MSDSVRMPALGESVTEGTVTRWLKQVGDDVAVDEPLLEVSTDKVDTEIPSPVAGLLLEILVAEDQTVVVGAELARIGSLGHGGPSTAQELPDGAEPASAAAPTTTAEPFAQAEPAAAPAPTGAEPWAQAEPAAGGDQWAQPEPAPASADQWANAEPAPAADQWIQAPTTPTADQSAQSAPTEPIFTATVQPPDEILTQHEDDAPAAVEAEASSSAPTTGTQGPSESVRMPALGESVTEGTVTRWLKQIGDVVAVDEPLLEVSTDKVDTEIPSPVAGMLLEILVAEDQTVAVGTELARVSSSPAQRTAAEAAPAEPTSDEAAEPAAPAENVPAASPAEEVPIASPAEYAPLAEPTPLAGYAAAVAPAEEAPLAEETPLAEEESTPYGGLLGGHADLPDLDAAAPASAVEPTPGERAASTVGGYLTPLVRKLAAEKGVDLSAVSGTGIGGRIRKDDVLLAAERIEHERAERRRAEQEAAAPTATTQSRRARRVAPPTPEVSPLRGTTEKASHLRQVIASRMVESMQTMAQLTTVVEVDVTRIARLRSRAKADFAAREGANLSFLPFFVLAATEALKAHPKVNGLLEGDQITYPAQENVGIAVDTERGLLVPVIRDAGDLNLAGIARKITDLAARTRENRVTPDELSGATFTVTNTGWAGALLDTPIVPGGTSAILATGAVTRRPVVATDADGEDCISVRSMCYLCLSYDHRLVDGADAARYLAAVKRRLEEGEFESELGL
jgi:pyruvate dehydrogenase E2 component (dihydrolipoamide acetyltransferase)